MKHISFLLSIFAAAAAFSQEAQTMNPVPAGSAAANTQGAQNAQAVQGQASVANGTISQAMPAGNPPMPTQAGEGQMRRPPQFGGSRRSFGNRGGFDRGERANGAGGGFNRGGFDRQGMDPRGGVNPLDAIDANGNMQGPFYFVDESPSQILQALEILQKKTILQAQGIPNVKINFVSKRKMTRDDAIAALTALLSLNGVAILPFDEKFLRAVPVIGVNRQSPEFLYGDIEKLPPSQTFYTRLFELQYMEAQFFLSKVRSSLSMEGVSVIEFFPRSNAVLITDNLINLQKADKMLKELDKPARLREDVAFIPVKNVGASDLREKLIKMQNEMLKKYFESTTIDVDTRTNQLIVVTNKGNLDIIKKFISGLDVESEPILKNEVYKIRHCKPAEITQVLNSIIQQQRQQVQRMTQAKSSNAATVAASAASAAARAAGGGNRQGQQTRNVNVNLAGLSSLSSGDGTTGLEFSDYVQVVAHEKSSSVVAYGTPADLKQLTDIISKLDVAVEQVKIDVIITEVNLTDTQVSGLSTFGISYNYPTASGNTNPFGDANVVDISTGTDTLLDSTIKPFSLNLGEKGFNAIFNTASEKQDVKVLSAPSIVTTHSVEAEITVSKQYPLITSSTTDLSSVTATKSEVEYKDIGITLLVTPYVGTDGKIQMEIKQNVDSILEYTTIDSNKQPVISKRYAKSTVYAENGEVIVLAGLQQTDATDRGGSVWLLGDIPLIGSLFEPKAEKSTRRELIIFIRPTVINSLDSESTISKYVKGKHMEREVTNYLRDGDFYSDKEVNANFEQFEKNRFYNKLVRSPDTLITGDQRMVEGSTQSIKDAKDAKEAKEAEDAAKNAKENSAEASDKNVDKIDDAKVESAKEAPQEAPQKTVETESAKQEVKTPSSETQSAKQSQ